MGEPGGQGLPHLPPTPPTAAAQTHLLQLLLPQFVGSFLRLQQGGQLLLLLPKDVLLELPLLGLSGSRLLLPDGLVPPGQLFGLSPKAARCASSSRCSRALCSSRSPLSRDSNASSCFWCCRRIRL